MSQCPTSVNELSHSLTDFITERNELMRSTFPQLRAYCQGNNLEFQVVDMRWGVRDENISYHQTSDICVQEIRNCQRLSLGPSFIVSHIAINGQTTFIIVKCCCDFLL